MAEAHCLDCDWRGKYDELVVIDHTVQPPQRDRKASLTCPNCRSREIRIPITRD